MGDDNGIDCIIKRRFQKKSIEKNPKMYVDQQLCFIEELRQVKDKKVNNLRMQFLNDGRAKKIELDFKIHYHNKPDLKKPSFLSSARDHINNNASPFQKRNHFKLRSLDKIGKCQIVEREKPLSPKTNKINIMHGR